MSSWQQSLDTTAMTRIIPMNPILNHNRRQIDGQYDRHVAGT